MTTEWSRGRAATRFDDPLDAVILDASLRQSLVAVQQLGRASLRVGAAEAVTPARQVPAFSSRWCSAVATIPHSRLERDPFIDSVIELVKQRSVRTIVPTHDGSIDAIQRRRSDLERLCAVALASPAALDAAIDKEQTLAAATGLGIRVPRAVRVAHEADGEAALAEIGLPAVVKPTRSWVIAPDGSTHRLSPVAVISTDECRAAIRTMFELGSAVLLQQWIRGARESVSFVHSGGTYYGEFAQVAQRMIPLLGGNSVVRESIMLPADAANDARRLVAELGLEGYAEVEFRRDDSGAPVLMEINPRLSASIAVAVRAGVDFPLLTYQWASGDRLESPRYRPGVRMRWFAGDVRWLVDTLRMQHRPDVVSSRHAVTEFVRSCGRRTGYDYMVSGDLRPAAHAAALGTRGVLRTVAHRFEKGNRA